jgi:saccharopine dehydrogenase-like NADP-dependent oxidoreductase
MQSGKRVLLIGSGLMTPALVDYLCSFKDTYITVASNLVKEAEGVASRHPQFAKAAYLDIFSVSILDILLTCRRKIWMQWWPHTMS